MIEILHPAVSQENVDKTMDFIAAYNRRDFDAAVEFFHPEVDWVLPALQRSDSCRGPDEIKRFWRPGLIPLMLGARDMAYPRTNAFGYWSFLLSGVLLYIAPLIGQAPHGVLVVR